MLPLLWISGALAQTAAPRFAAPCRVEPPRTGPLFETSDAKATPAPAATDATSDSADDDDDGDDTGDDSSDETSDDKETGNKGVQVTNSDVCLAISGSLTFAYQSDRFKGNPLTNRAGLLPPSGPHPIFSSSLRLEAKTTLGNGWDAVAAVEGFASHDGRTGAPSLSEASLLVGPIAFGVIGSRFDYWGGDDFVFSAQVPSRTVGMLAAEQAITSELSLSASLEWLRLDQSQSGVKSASNLPDAVLRLLYEGESLTIHGALAARRLEGSLTASARTGRAAILGVSKSLDWGGMTTTLTAQWAGAIDMPPYIGSSLDTRVARGILGADDPTRGWSGVVALKQDWTDTIASSAYVSRYRLTVPLTANASGRIAIDRVAVNTVWTPVEGIKVGVEGSVAWQRIDFSGRVLSLFAFSGNQKAVQLFLEGSF